MAASNNSSTKPNSPLSEKKVGLGDLSHLPVSERVKLRKKANEELMELSRQSCLRKGIKTTG